MKFKKTITQILLGSTFLLAGSLSQAADPDSEALVELYQRLEVMGKEINQLRGENETLRHDLTQVKKSQKQAFLAIDDRMDKARENQVKAVTPKPVVAQQKPARPTPPRMQPPVVKPAVAKPAAAKPAVAKPVAVKPPVTKPAPAKPVAVQKAGSNDKVDYSKAYEILKKNRQAGINSFKAFLVKYPKSPLAENAHYWIGEAWYSQRNYRGAIDSFVVVLNKYKSGRKAPDAAVKLGYSFYALKDWNMARRTFNDVLRYFPKSHAAKLAKARLEKMKQEGH